MRRIILFHILLLSQVLHAQQSKIDSAMSWIAAHPGDSTEVRTMIWIGDEYTKENTVKALGYYRSALQLSEQRGYLRLIPEILNSLGALYHLQSKYDSSRWYHQRALMAARQNKQYIEIFQANQGLAESFMRESENDSAKYYLQQALLIAKKRNDYGNEADVYNNLGNVYLGQADLTESLAQFIKAATIYDSLAPNPMGLSRALSNIGNIEYILGHYDKAMNYLRRSLVIANANAYGKGIAYCHKLAGRIYRKQSNFDQALDEYRKALIEYDKMGDRQSGSEIHLGIGNLYYDLKQYENAIAEYDQALRLSRTIRSPESMAYNYSAMAQGLNAIKNFKRASAYFDSALIMARQVKNPYLVMDAYQALSDMQAEQHNYKKAFEFHQLFTDIKDSLNSYENRQVTEELESKYQNSKNQSEIQLLQKDKLLQAAALEQQQSIQVVTYITLVSVIIISVLVFNRYRIINRTKRALEVERMRNTIARDLHDDIGSALSSIHIMSQLAGKENAVNSYLPQIGELSARTLESMSDIVWSINPSNDSLEQVIAHMKEFGAEILEPQDINYKFQEGESLKSTTLDSEKRKNIFLIFKEAVNNAAKYSECTFLDVNISVHENQLVMSITDNGKGFHLADVRSGNGLKNIRARAADLGATLDFQTTPGSGTTVTLQMPLT